MDFPESRREFLNKTALPWPVPLKGGAIAMEEVRVRADSGWRSPPMKQVEEAIPICEPLCWFNFKAIRSAEASMTIVRENLEVTKGWKQAQSYGCRGRATMMARAKDKGFQ